MTFLDTNIWVELFATCSPETAYEQWRAKESSSLLRSLLDNGERIITFDLQLLELIVAIEKVKSREVNKSRKKLGLSGIGNLKEFRNTEEFKEVQVLCANVLEDMMCFAQKVHITDITWDYISDLVSRLNQADLNDCIYYDYCIENDIEIYSFDHDLQRLGESPKLHIL